VKVKAEGRNGPIRAVGPCIVRCSLPRAAPTCGVVFRSRNWPCP
jgi:hypothetical protein